jgi:hypothetical protein
VAAALSASGQSPVKYVLSDEVILADPAPAPQFAGGPGLAALFQSRFESAFPGQVKRLSHDSPEGMIGPDERVILILPTITAARVGHAVKAGSIHTFEAVIVGDVSAIDPWTEANLFSGTRMVSAVVELGQSKLTAADARLREAFQTAAAGWLDSSIGQLREQLAPFVLDGATLQPPSKSKKFEGGLWPFGSERGVRRGAALSGGGRYAVVREVFPKFSRIVDAASPQRPIPAGERYLLTMVLKPSERPEPTIELAWVGGPPRAPADLRAPTLSTDAFLGLFNNYLSKGGGLRILPVPLTSTATKDRLRQWGQTINAYSLQAEGNLTSFDRETLVQSARETPDRLVEMGILERFHGRRPKQDGSVEHYYRLTLAASVGALAGAEDRPSYPLDAVVKHQEEYALVVATGIRELDEKDAWFTVCRNGVINLGRKLREGAMSGAAAGRTLREGTVGPGGAVDWQGGQPDALAPLTWLRPEGEAVGSNGQSLGPCFAVLQPRQGYLNPSVLAGEKLKPGDVLRYEASAQAKPLASIELLLQANPPSWFPEPLWVERLAAKMLAAAGDARFVPAEAGRALGTEKRVKVLVSALGASEQAGGMSFTGQWRFQLFPAQAAEGAPPSLKFGIQSDAPMSIPADALRPLDTGGWGLEYTTGALKKLAESGAGKGLKQAFHTSDY